MYFLQKQYKWFNKCFGCAQLIKPDVEIYDFGLSFKDSLNPVTLDDTGVI